MFLFKKLKEKFMQIISIVSSIFVSDQSTRIYELVVNIQQFFRMAKVILFILVTCMTSALTQGGNIFGTGGRSNHYGSYSRDVAEFGIGISAQVYEAVCWFEFLKIYLPTTRGLDFNQCHGQASYQKKMILRQRADEKYFGWALMNYAMRDLPKDYMQCSHYLLEDRFKKPQTNYSKILNDNAVGFIKADEERGAYPYQAFAHCMISVVHHKYKDGAIQNISEKITKEKDFIEAMLERENELRAIHNTPPLVLSNELNERAQKWAEQLARDCSMYHIHSSHSDYLLNGSRMGENLFTGNHIHSPPDEVSLFAVSIWYEEISYYPWPEYKGYGNDNLFHKFAHFSQIIWKDSKEVGYGFAANMNRNCSKYFVVSRYYPPGNIYDTFAENVLPPIITKVK